MKGGNLNISIILVLCIIIFSIVVITYVRDPLRIASKDRDFLGSKDAEITIIEFGDYLDSNTSNMNPVIDTIIREFPEDIKFVFKPYLTKNDSIIAAQGVKCSKDSDKLWRMHNTLLNAKLTTITPIKLYQYAKELEIKVTKMQKCIDGEIYKEMIEKNSGLGDRLKIKTLPTIFINKRRIEGMTDLDTIREIITKEIGN
ncbi:DsbA family protein [archaeon]|jgi:protein-disulfide isomerase|nr:DsbA family protein [archaeon]MBT6823926.1 DsbA family protein [archaeon]MBT7106826.1 DsbA family protein [archaeon]MBT7297503.1 DsbA family protein [archaeon]